MSISFTSTTETVEDDGGVQYEDFLDDPFNMAMYVVLPAMIFVYGGCCFIYCMAKLHRYCRRRSRRRARRRLIQKDKDGGDDNSDDDNTTNRSWDSRLTSLSVVDLTDPLSESAQAVTPVQPVEPVKSAKPSKPAVSPKPAKPVVYPKPVKRVVYPKPAKRDTHEVYSKPVVSVTRSSSTASGASASNTPSRGVQPGYVKPQNLHQQMQHLDDQLKAAFKLITTETPKIKSRPDVCAKNNKNGKPVARKGLKSGMQFFISEQ